MEIILMRHGKTIGNIERRYNGRTDDPLCPEGVEHARQTGFDGSVRTVYVSPLKRAVETAGIKFPNAAQIPAADLREMDFGIFEGRCAEELKDDAEYTRWLQSGCTLPCPGGEEVGAFSDRVCRAFEDIVGECLQRGEEKLVVVAHGGSIMAILSKYGRPARSYYEWYADNCGGYRAVIDPSAWTVNQELSLCERFQNIGGT